jgi:hypothetical protein
LRLESLARGATVVEIAPEDTVTMSFGADGAAWIETDSLELVAATVTVAAAAEGAKGVGVDGAGSGDENAEATIALAAVSAGRARDGASGGT